MTAAICERAGRLAVTARLHLADSVIYATAQEHSLTLVTRDNGFKGLKDTVVLR